MGNQQCCDQNQQQQYEQSNINSKKYSSTIHKFSNAQNKSLSIINKHSFTGNNAENDKQSNHSSKISSHKSSKKSQQQYKLPQFSSQQNSQLLNKQKINNLNDYIKSQSVKNSSDFHISKAYSDMKIKPLKIQKKSWENQNVKLKNNQKDIQYSNENSQNYQSIFNQNEAQKSQSFRYSVKTQIPFDSPMFKNQASTLKKQIQIWYNQTVKKVLQRQKPFSQQLQKIPKQKIKVIKVNNLRDIYKGQLNYYEKPHGIGMLIKQNQNVLIGEFNNGSAQGKAFYVFKDGSYFKGNMINNKANGYGEYHSLKFTYIGQFQKNLFHGKGKQFGDNYYFEGQYQNHLKKSGILKWNSQINTQNRKSSKNKSNQSENEIFAIRKIQQLPKFIFIYQGSFDKQQKFTGKGKLKDPNGEYIGDFNQGKKQGQGQYTYDNKLRYAGGYVNDKKQGYGKLYNCDNTMAYEGFWKHDLPDGKGYSYDLKGNKLQQHFIQGISSLIAP